MPPNNKAKVMVIILLFIGICVAPKWIKANIRKTKTAATHSYCGCLNIKLETFLVLELHRNTALYAIHGFQLLYVFVDQVFAAQLFFYPVGFHIAEALRYLLG